MKSAPVEGCRDPKHAVNTAMAASERTSLKASEANTVDELKYDYGACEGRERNRDGEETGIKKT